MLAIGRALMAKPKLILLDEPSLGLAPLLVEEIFSILTRMNSEEKLTLLLVEQNAAMALSIAHYGYIMENGGRFGRRGQSPHGQRRRQGVLPGAERRGKKSYATLSTTREEEVARLKAGAPRVSSRRSRSVDRSKGELLHRFIRRSHQFERSRPWRIA